jgi:hypothetical protein
VVDRRALRDRLTVRGERPRQVLESAVDRRFHEQLVRLRPLAVRSPAPATVAKTSLSNRPCPVHWSRPRPKGSEQVSHPPNGPDHLDVEPLRSRAGATGGRPAQPAGHRLTRNACKPLFSLAPNCRKERMVRRGSTVRVRERASRVACTWRLLVQPRLAMLQIARLWGVFWSSQIRTGAEAPSAAVCISDGALGDRV